MTEQPVIVAEYARILVDLTVNRGISRELLFRNAGLEAGMIQDPGAHMPWNLFERLARAAIDLTGDASIGLQFGSMLTLPTHGFLGYAAMSSETLGDALDLAVKYFKTRISVFDLSMNREGNQAILQLDEAAPLGDLLPFGVETLFSCLYTIGISLTGEESISGEVRVTYPPGAGSETFFQAINQPVYYNSEHNQIRFPAEKLQLKLDFSDPRLQRMAEEQCARQMTSSHDEEGLLGKVRRILIADIEQNSSLEAVASQLHFSSRTLKRRLKSLDTSFQKILDEVRKGLAIEYLTQTGKNVEEIASMLGYSDPSNFGRAFKKWTGKSPSEYRK